MDLRNDKCTERSHRLLMPLLITAGVYLPAYLVSSLFFGITLTLQGALIDLLLLSLIGTLCFISSRTIVLFTLMQSAVIGVLLIGNAVKISFNGAPIMPDDVHSLHALLLILEDRWRYTVIAVLALPGLLLLANLRWDWRSWLASGTGLAVLCMPVLLVPASTVMLLDRVVGDTVWNQRENYLTRGAALHFLQETARLRAENALPPEAEDVLIALQRLPQDVREAADVQETPRKRSIHLIVLESFWDPSLLQNAHFSRDPFDERFRALWEATGRSTALVPVFGGYTANSEFELLCGFPIARDGVKFERRLTNAVPCLPALLRELGYSTVASHPNVAAFWNRHNVYSRLGFQTYYSLRDFELDDVNEEFLSDESLYRQVLQKTTGGEFAPTFNYVLTYFGHWWYPLNEKRPPVIRARSAVEEVENYANTIYYKSAELMDYIAAVLMDDPDALIIALGDHLPTLGPNFQGYVESQVFGETLADFDAAMFRTYVSTPLLVVDGRNGPLSMGSVPTYQLPNLILELLGIRQSAIWDFARPPGELRIRPLPGLNLVVDGLEETVVCWPETVNTLCDTAARWLQGVEILDADIFMGHGHAIRHLPVAQDAVPATRQQLGGSIRRID